MIPHPPEKDITCITYPRLSPRTPKCRLGRLHTWERTTGRSETCRCGMVRWHTARSIWYYKVYMYGQWYVRQPHKRFWEPVEGGPTMREDTHLTAPEGSA